MLFSRLATAALFPMLLSAPASAQPAASQTILMWSYNYSPKPIHLRAGRPVTLTFANRSGSGHDFTAKRFFASSRFLNGAAPGGKIEVGPGAARTITLVPLAGTYPAHCGHFLHKQFGMQDLIVVD